MSNDIKYNLSVINWIFEQDNDEQPTGVIVQVDNGDTQYLTINEYENLNNNGKSNIGV